MQPSKFGGCDSPHSRSSTVSKAAINPEGVEGDLPVTEETEIVAGADGALVRAAVR